MEKKREWLTERLKEYSESDFYPFHMPGHKRNGKESYYKHFPEAYAVDITEIEGFDNLHHPEGILKDSMEWAARLYGVDQTYYLVNGSSCGILSAIFGSTSYGGTILMSRNCHKSAYHGVILNHLKTHYIYPQIIPEFGLQGGLLPEDVERMLKSDKKIQAVLVVSPTYDGIVSDIEAIAKLTHRYHIPLIVDEAHGAHFPYGEGFPVSALTLGADVVIQSLHKTLPSFTQTAIMHVRKGYVDQEKIDRYVSMFQSSSPSYLLLAGIENCIRWMHETGRERMEEFYALVTGIRERLGEMKCLRLLPVDLAGSYGIYDVDPSKVLVSCAGTGMNGSELKDQLRRQYHLEMEMCGPDYVTALCSVADTEDGLNRLCGAYLEIDKKLEDSINAQDTNRRSGTADRTNLINKLSAPESTMGIAEALDAPFKCARLEESAGKIIGEFIYLYPPGIPIVAPGEKLTEEMISLILKYKEMGLPVQGLDDKTLEWIRVVGNGHDILCNG